MSKPVTTQYPHQSTGLGSGGDDRERENFSAEAIEFWTQKDLAKAKGIDSPTSFYRPIQKDL